MTKKIIIELITPKEEVRCLMWLWERRKKCFKRISFVEKIMSVDLGIPYNKITNWNKRDKEQFYLDGSIKKIKGKIKKEYVVNVTTTYNNLIEYDYLYISENIISRYEDKKKYFCSIDGDEVLKRLCELVVFWMKDFTEDHKNFTSADEEFLMKVERRLGGGKDFQQQLK